MSEDEVVRLAAWRVVNTWTTTSDIAALTDHIGALRVALSAVPEGAASEDDVEMSLWWRCRCHDIVMSDCPNRELIAAALRPVKGGGG